MKPLRRSFCFGIIVASFLWLCVIYFVLWDIEEDGSTRWLPSSRRRSHLKPRYQITGLPPSAKDDLSEIGLVRNPQDQVKREQGYKLYAFNELISDRLSFHRPIPDVRHQLCQSEEYPAELPSASVVICFYNEAWSVLLRTVHSIIDRTPSALLHEIILVDDFSDLDHLAEQLDAYVSEHLPQTKLVRNTRREGLIRARVIGSEHATGEVLVFLDSHCEVNVEWIQPLLSHIHGNHKRVAVPIIDIIDQDTFRYESSPLVRGGFNWGLFYRWDQIPESLLRKQEDYVKPIKTPTMAGGLFAMNRKYFNDLGRYDTGMDVWGGENLEISFRVWQCGGSMHILPCSRVGHIFRKRRPYGSPVGVDTITKNSLRVAHVWMDEYIKYFFQVRKTADHAEYGDVSDRKALRNELQCQSFKWFLDNVYPEQTLPSDKEGGGLIAKGHNLIKKDPEVIRKAHLKHFSSTLCVVASRSPYDKKSLLELKPCNPNNKQQVWHETFEGSMRLMGVLCLDFVDDSGGGNSPYPMLSKCHFSGGSQQWSWLHKKQLLNPASGRCLTITKDTVSMATYLSVEFCDQNNPSQHFIMRNFKEK
ncbi:hypothetical protein CAPTEDRAFT_176696 [Capitella teleta]|uniref:Polypeptide N-acetylgalactosaminyltransferase n=1 Tax=Capitella teleta TaxID=283909 RepID=R7V1Y2_CAPTE|nr:hypothetical protein CAPTEDRAFT_176696 [Capitella teleta]|eukprot:ELU10336.1 hypothetical protein CAPTEDRAFT_176696 [Capitella teleta]